jgi:hypothetical protein
MPVGFGRIRFLAPQLTQVKTDAGSDAGSAAMAP